MAFAAAGEPTSSSFVAGVADEQWTVLRPVTEGNLAYGFVQGLGLRLNTQTAGMQQTPYNTFTRPANAASWEAVAKVYYPVSPSEDYQQICFGVMQDDDNYVKLDIEFNHWYTPTRMVQFSINRGGTYTHTHRTYLSDALFPAPLNATRANDLVAYLKITKTNDVYKAAVSLDGVNYVTVGSRTTPSGGTNTNGEYTVSYAEPKIFVAAINDNTSASLETYCEFIKVYNVNGQGGSPDILAEAFEDVSDYVLADWAVALATLPADVKLKEGDVFDVADFADRPKVPYGYSYRLTSDDPATLYTDALAATAIKEGKADLSLELVQDSRTKLLKKISVDVSKEGQTTYDPVTVQFYYNYTGAPATRPASFTKTTGTDGKLAEFPVEQTLPQVGSRADYGFVGWYRNPEGTGGKVTLDTVLTEDTSLYAKWEVTPSLWREYEDYFLMGAFADYSTGSAQMQKHYNINCPSNNFKLNSQINTTTMRNNFVAARTRILADATLNAKEKEDALQKANEEIVLNANPTVMTHLNNIRNWNNTHPESEKKYTRFHVVAWHGGQQPNQFFTNAYLYSNDSTSLARSQNLADANQDGAFASRETMKARLDNYIRQVMERYAPYKDIIVSWDIINEPVDDFTGQIRNGSDSNSQRGQWGLVWHDKNPARNADGSLKFTEKPDAMYVINEPERLYDESEWMRWAFESAAKWTKENNCDWGLYVNDYMDSNKLYTKLQPTLDVLKDIDKEVDLKGVKLAYGLQGRLAWAYPTIDMLRKQVEDALEIVDEIGVTEGDIRSDFEPNPFFDPTQPTLPVTWLTSAPIPKWTANDLNSGSGSNTNPTPSTLTNTFDTHNSPVRRIPEWGTGNGMTASSARYGATGFLPISEAVMKKQADFAADWMDILIDHADKVELFQWDGTSDSGTFNSSKGAHLWVTGVTGRTGTFEKYSFYAVIGAPARDKLKKAIKASPALTDASEFVGNDAWDGYVEKLNAANALLTKRIYTLEGVNDVKDATAALYEAAATLEETRSLLAYDANGGSGEATKDGYATGADATVKSDVALGFSKAGYVFDGWNAKADGSGASYAAGAVVKMDGNITLYAQWKAAPTSYSVSFETYDGTKIAAVAVPVGGKVQKPVNPVKQGYDFAGWYRDMALTNAWDFAADAVNDNIRLYARWIPNYIRLSYGRAVGAASTATEVVAGRTLTVEAEAMIANGKPHALLVALYNEKGQLAKLATADSVFDGVRASFYLNFDIPAEATSEYSVKAFIWNTSTFAPLRGAVTLS
jgi:uncharacterized repeat protein (TIGR02543 family)